MPTMLGILQNSHGGCLGTLTVLGIQGLRPRTLPIWRVMITPLLFCGWGIESLIVQSLSAPVLLVDWVITCAVAAVLTFALTHLNNVRINPGEQSVSLVGSPFLLIRNLLIFFTKYGLGVASALAPALRPELALLDVAVSAASAGYFVAWMIRFASVYRRFVSPDLAAEARL